MFGGVWRCLEVVGLVAGRNARTRRPYENPQGWSARGLADFDQSTSQSIDQSTSRLVEKWRDGEVEPPSQGHPVAWPGLSPRLASRLAWPLTWPGPARPDLSVTVSLCRRASHLPLNTASSHFSSSFSFLPFQARCQSRRYSHNSSSASPFSISIELDRPQMYHVR